MKKIVLLLSGFTMIFSVSSFASCEASALKGAWTRSISDVEQVDSGKTWIWDFQHENLVATIQLNDSWTATGTGGPYFEKETRYETKLDENCTLFLKPVGSTERTLRKFEELTPDLSEKIDTQSGPILEYKISISADARALIVTDPNNTTVTFKRIR